MEYYPMLVKAHGGFGYLSFLFCFISLMLATLAAFMNSRIDGAIKVVGIIETASVGLLTLSGLAVWVLGPWPWVQGYILVGLVIAVIYSIVLKRFVKPAREIKAPQAAKLWAAWQGLLFILLVAAFGLMQAKPF